MTKSHLNLSQRILIESKLNNNVSFRNIAKITGKSHTTISREVLKRRVLIKGNTFNMPNMKCEKLIKAPFVCNGCPNVSKCRKNKHYYYAEDANNNYKEILTESRLGIDFENDEFRNMDKNIKDEISKGHSFYMITIDHPEFNITERTLYNYQEKGYLQVRDTQLPRKVRYKKRKRKVSKSKNERAENSCRIGRTYADFTIEILNKNITSYAEMDTVEGIKGHSCLLTLCLKDIDFLFAYKIESQTVFEITNIINNIKKTITPLAFHILFPYILTDNGSEFKRPDLIENNGPDIVKSKIYYCDSRRSDQKGTIEVTHEYIRRFIPQGTNFDDYTQSDINLMLNHINNTKRKNLNNKSPYELLKEKIDEETIKKLEFYFINPNDIILNSSLFKKQI